MTRTAPFQHSDGSPCWTKNCSLDHVATINQAIKNNDPKSYLEARAAVDNRSVTQKQTTTHRALEYNSANYRLFINRAEELDSKIVGDEAKAVMEYTGWAYQDYYAYLEGTSGELNPQKERALIMGALSIDSAIKKAGKLDKPIAVFRGEKAPAGVSVTDHLAATFPVGEDVKIKRYLSTSMDAKVASEITGDNASSSYLVVIKTAEGAMLSENTSEHGLREKEVLLPRNRTYHVDSISSDAVSWGTTKKQHVTVHLTMT